MKTRVTRGIARDVPNWGPPAGQLPAGSLRFPIGSKNALLRQICRTGYTQIGRYEPTSDGLPEPLTELGDMALFGRVPVEVQLQ